MINQIKKDGVWIDGDPKDEGQMYRIKMPAGSSFGYEEKRFTKLSPSPLITLTVTLDKSQCLVGETVNYTIDFSESITVNGIVPISVTDRQGKHITNIGCTITDGKAKGSFSMPVSGDFTVTNESINFHKISIDTELKIANEFWLRVYQ